MDNNYTHISVLFDASGSMQRLTKDMFGGLSKLIAEQKEKPGKATISISKFDSVYSMRYQFEDLATMPALKESDFYSGGLTALNDALGKLMIETGSKLQLMEEKDRPAAVMFIVITDGEENASKEFNVAKVKEMITEQEEKYNWQFIYLGANVDVIKESSNYNFKNALSFNASADSVNVMYSALSNMTSSVRGASAAGEDFSLEKKLYKSKGKSVEEVNKTL